MRPYAITTASILALIAITFVVNQNALTGYWRFDDGWLLDYASRFSPSDYFFVPAITRGYSLNNLTPFNPLLYDLNLWLFGVSPQGFYIQHLALMAGCAVMTFLLLRIWLRPGFALFGAVLFLLGAPSLIVSQQLMVGHYLAGLLFSLLALYAFVRSLERESAWLALLAALCYLLATACKEIYVPLPISLLFIQKASAKRRLLHSLPMYLWVACYSLWRYSVLGGFIGGYQGLTHEAEWSMSLLQFVEIPQLLFGATPLGTLVMLVILGLFCYTAMRGRLNLALLALSACAVLLPLVPLLGSPGITRPDRYLFLPWWLLCMLCTIILAQLPTRRYPYRLALSLLLLGAVTVHAQQVMSDVRPRLAVFDTIYRLFASPAPDSVYLSRNPNAYHQDTVLNGLRNAINRVSGSTLQRIGILTHRESLSRVDASRRTIVHYDQSCACIRELDQRVIEQAGSQRVKAPELLAITLSPPFPPLFDPAQGAIEKISVEASDLRITGWTGLPREDLEQQFLVITPSKPKQTQLSRRRIETESDRIQRYGFDLRISFHDEPSAITAKTQLCLLTRSMLTPVKLIRGAEHSGCGGFLKSQP
jgi:hypothetical protein